MKAPLQTAALAIAALAGTAWAADEPPPLRALPALQVPAYMGTWYQVAWFPNRFQSQCVADTSATYRQLPEGRVEVVNRCRRADGRYAVVSEPQRQYLWVLSRTPRLLPADELAIRSLLAQGGFDLSRWQAHPHTASP